MGRTYTVTVFTSLILSRSIFGYTGDPMMFYSPYDARSNTFMGPSNPAYQYYQPMSRTIQQPAQRPLLHKNPEAVLTDHHDQQNFTINDLLDSINEGSHKEEEPEHFKSVTRDYDYMPYPGPSQMSYNSPKPSYGPPQPPAYTPAPHHPAPAKFSLLKPDLVSLLMKPVTTKVASKVSGLLSLVLTLLTGSAPDDLEVKGFKDIVINGILKPLLIAKGGIKSLISKLAIPVISLLLINLEVLVTVWWLWDECPEQKPTYNYVKPEYNSYHSYS
ncbi:hypothetical protein K1T71_007141 [Dendrolimus kikuchii]|uniref:Uncharacterized protein n=1 Tax=Dendrolimus kikuchii TaxID=765133 RepID=A0ACC1D0T0_9NEOP|nr:hypothetical protein K1T71_007141 [Dendrolimus kikuchii]